MDDGKLVGPSNGGSWRSSDDEPPPHLKSPIERCLSDRATHGWIGPLRALPLHPRHTRGTVCPSWGLMHAFTAVPTFFLQSSSQSRSGFQSISDSRSTEGQGGEEPAVLVSNALSRLICINTSNVQDSTVQYSTPSGLKRARDP
jgi:hypothetical protein